MNYRSWRSMAISFVLAASLVGGGCAATWDPYWTEVDVAPPEPMAEVSIVRPGADYVWQPGYWYWTGSRYTWVRGHWVRRPGAGHVWVRSGWVVVDGRYRFIRGHWVPRAHRPKHKYVHPRPRRTDGPKYHAQPRKPSHKPHPRRR